MAGRLSAHHSAAGLASLVTPSATTAANNAVAATERHGKAWRYTAQPLQLLLGVHPSDKDPDTNVQLLLVMDATNQGGVLQPPPAAAAGQGNGNGRRSCRCTSANRQHKQQQRAATAPAAAAQQQQHSSSCSSRRSTVFQAESSARSLETKDKPVMYALPGGTSRQRKNLMRQQKAQAVRWVPQQTHQRVRHPYRAGGHLPAE